MANFYRPESLAEWAKARPCLPGPPPADPPLRGGEAGAVGLAAQPAELPATGALRRCYTPRGQPKRKVLEIEGGAKQFDRPADEAAGGRREIRAREGQFAILCGERAAAAGTAAAGCRGARAASHRAPEGIPGSPEQDNDTAEGLQIRIGTTPWRRQRFPGAPAISGLPGLGGPPLADRPYGD
jgi:hypothetical protein